MLLRGKIVGKYGTLDKFCKDTGWSRRKIGAILNGRQRLNKEDILFLSDILGIESRNEFLSIFFDELSTKWTC